MVTWLSLVYLYFKGHYGVTAVALTKDQILYGNSKFVQQINSAVCSK